jgi:hypothetical protein
MQENPVLESPYWISLDPLLDVDRLAGMHEQFCYAVANSIRNAGGYGAFHSSGNFLSGKLKQFLELPFAHPQRQLCRGMDLYQISLYVGLLNQGVAVSEMFNLTTMKERISLGLKHSGDYWRPYTPNYHLFGFFIEWLEAQQIFDSYGRIYGFLNCPYQDAPAHVDMEERDKPCEFIWLRTSLDKPFFVLPHSAATPTERSYVQGHVAWFNPGMWHGAGFTDYYAFSLRVDGVFTTAFRSKIYELHQRNRV